MKVSFIGHRNIERTPLLMERLTGELEQLILYENADTFLFGSRSEFNDLCYEAVTGLIKKYKNIRRVFVRGEYEYINKQYTDYLLTLYEETIFPEVVHNAHAMSYIKRNRVMIDMCDVLITYYNKQYTPKSGTRSGTKIAVEYACSKKKRIINLFN